MDRTTELPWQDVTRRLKGRMLDRGVRTAEDLSQLSGVNRSSLSLKMTGKRRWRIEDLQALASSLETSVAFLIGETENPDQQAETVESVDIPHAELHRRLTFLGAPEASRALLAPPEGSPFSSSELEAIAIRCDVPIGYLTGFDSPDAAERVEALVEFSRTLQSSGVQRIATRSLGALSAEELRALTRVIKRS